MVSLQQQFLRKAEMEYRSEWEQSVRAWLQLAKDRYDNRRGGLSEQAAVEQSLYAALMVCPFPVGRYLDTVRHVGTLAVREQIQDLAQKTCRAIQWPGSASAVQQIVEVAMDSVIGQIGQS